jgi:cell division protein FtsW
MVFIAGVPISWVIAALASAFSAFAAMLMLISNSQARIVDWLQSLTNPLAGSNQQVQALIALGRGGFVGQGPGNSMQKLFYVAEPFNDFIFAIFGEEYGFVGCAVIVLLYLLLFLRGLQIVRRSQDPFARMLALGIIGIFFMHSVINIYVATGLFPVTGQTLPLFSYGGTSMITMLGALGILLNISYQARKLQPGREMK